MPRVTRTAQADADIEEILLRLARRSTRAMNRVSDDIDATCRRLANFPRLGKSRDELAPGLFSYPSRDGYTVYYVPTDGGIEVQRVVHGSRQVDPSMFDV
jgi:toxin ParE1/3/4